jgi:hypothetical protein
MRFSGIVLAVVTTVAAVVAVNALLLGKGSGGDDRVGNLSPRASLNVRTTPTTPTTPTTTTRTVTTRPATTTTTTATTTERTTTAQTTTTDDHGRRRGRGSGSGGGRDD